MKLKLTGEPVTRFARARLSPEPAEPDLCPGGTQRWARFTGPAFQGCIGLLATP